MPVTSDEFRFMFLADIQLGCYASFTGLTEAEVVEYRSRGFNVEVIPDTTGFAWDARQYRDAVKAINDLRPDLVVIGGDMVDAPDNEAQAEAFFRITATIDPGIPVKLVPGNHDIAPDTVVPTRESINLYRARFGPDFYAFTMGKIRFIVLNTSVIQHPENVADELADQMAFLETELSEKQRRSHDEVVLFGHHPLFLLRADEPDSRWNLPLEARRPILELLHSSGVRYGFAGHWHRNAIATEGTFTQVTSGPVGYPLGNDPSGYRVVSLGPAGLSHEYHALDDWRSQP